MCCGAEGDPLLLAEDLFHMFPPSSTSEEPSDDGPDELELDSSVELLSEEHDEYYYDPTEKGRYITNLLQKFAFTQIARILAP